MSAAMKHQIDIAGFGLLQPKVVHVWHVWKSCHCTASLTMHNFVILIIFSLYGFL